MVNDGWWGGVTGKQVNGKRKKLARYSLRECSVQSQELYTQISVSSGEQRGPRNVLHVDSFCVLPFGCKDSVGMMLSAPQLNKSRVEKKTKDTQIIYYGVRTIVSLPSSTERGLARHERNHRDAFHSEMVFAVQTHICRSIRKDRVHSTFR